jgi:adenylate cyclase
VLGESRPCANSVLGSLELLGRARSLLRHLVQSRQRHWLVLAVLAVGMFASGLCFSVLRSLERQKVEAQFRDAARQRLDDLQSHMDTAMDKVADLSAFCASRQPLTRAWFDLFAGQVSRNQAAIQALEWTPPVPLARRAALERSARAEGLQGFEIRDRVQGRMVRAAERLNYFPVVYIYPQAGNEIVYGYDDLAASAVRREVLDRALAAGKLSASARLVLAQENSPDQFGVLLVQPVYRSSSTGQFAASAPPQFLGFVEGVLRLGAIVRRHGEGSGVDLSIVVLTAVPGVQHLYPAVDRG